MEKRPEGFLDENNFKDGAEMFMYIKELHEYLWAFIKTQHPRAEGRINDFIDKALEKAKAGEFRSYSAPKVVGKKSDDFTYGSPEYYHLRTLELEQDRDRNDDRAKYYQTELETSHALLGRVIHQTSERWDTVNISSYFPTDNLFRNRTGNNPTGEKKK